MKRGGLLSLFARAYRILFRYGNVGGVVVVVIVAVVVVMVLLLLSPLLLPSSLSWLLLLFFCFIIIFCFVHISFLSYSPICKCRVFYRAQKTFTHTHTHRSSSVCICVCVLCIYTRYTHPLIFPAFTYYV